MIRERANGAQDTPRYPYLQSKWRGEQAVIESGLLTDAGDRYTAAGPVPALAILSSQPIPKVPLLRSVRYLSCIHAYSSPTWRNLM